MKYLKLFEKHIKYKFKIGDYVKILPDAGTNVDIENRGRMIDEIFKNI